MAEDTHLLEPGAEPDLSCGLAENPCPDPAPEDDSDHEDDVPEVNDYDTWGDE